jgi:AraC-like DNA-binding protein
MDPLSDLLSLIEVQSSLSSRFEARGRWAFRFPGYGAHIKFGCVLNGSYLIWAEGTPAPVRLEAGDFFMLSHGRPFLAATDLQSPPQDGTHAFRDHRDADGVVRYVGLDDDGKTFVSSASGRFMFDGEAGDLLLRHLPPLLHLRAADPATRPLTGLLELLRWETGEARPGSSLAQANLASLVLVQALRIYLGNAAQPEGWLGAMADARIGTALSRMHGDLARRWTVESLALAAGMSRTAFAVRFKQLTGSTPLDYLSAWRMTVARRALRKTDEGIAGIAERVGYLSDTAFSSAFKRATGQSPGSFRNSRRAAVQAAP